MKKLILPLLLLFSSTAPLFGDCQAQVCGPSPENFYAGIFAGVNIQDFQFKELDLSASETVGFVTGAVAGFYWNVLRLEGEASYRSNNYSHLDLLDEKVNGKKETLALMVNGYVDLLCWFDCFHPYAGIGYGYFSSHSEVRSDVTKDLRIAALNECSPAFQLIAGFGRRIRDFAEIDIEYRYFHATRITNEGHSVVLGLKTLF